MIVECPLLALVGDSCLDFVDDGRDDLPADVDFRVFLFVSKEVPSRIHDFWELSLCTGGTYDDCVSHSFPEDSRSTSSVLVSAGDEGASTVGRARA